VKGPKSGWYVKGAAYLAGTQLARQDFLQEMQAAASQEHPAIAEGTDVQFSAPQLAGAALVDQGRVVHLAAFRLAEELG
jgi:hypothetical protein